MISFQSWWHVGIWNRAVTLSNETGLRTTYVNIYSDSFLKKSITINWRIFFFRNGKSGYKIKKGGAHDSQPLGMKTIRIFSDRIRDRIRLERFRSVRIWVRIFNIRYRIRIRIFKLYIYDVDIQSYLIRHDWYYPYSNPNPTTNMKTNMILVISVRIRSVFIPINHSRFVTFFYFH